MTGKAFKYLYDILNSIKLIEDFLQATPVFFDYEKDLKTISAVERQLGIIGEAVNKLKSNNPDITLSYSKEIINFRNRLIHAYDSVDNSIVWAIKTNHLPVLKREIENILNTHKI